MEEELKDLVIPKDQIILHKEYILGRGGYGYVCYAKREKADGSWEDVAAKMMITEGSIPETTRKELIKEACKLREVSQHDNIVKLLGVLMEIDNYGLILELMVFENSIAFINKYAVEWPQNKLPIQLSQQVSSAMAYLHTFNPPMLHMDLKGDNILINHNFDAKICDFGIAEWKTRTTRAQDSRRGTLSHIAPEVLLNVNIKSTMAQDVYSFGICTWEIFTGLKPYSSKSDELIKTCVKDGQRPDMKDIGERCPDYVVTMMKQCWNQDPDLRPTFDALQKQLGAMCKKMKREIFLGKKAVRRQICRKHSGVNDIKRLMTNHWDDLNDLNDSGEISIDAMPNSPQATVDISVCPQDEMPKEKPDNVAEVKPCKESMPLPGKRYKFGLPKKDLTPFDTKVREILRDPLLLEMVVSGNVDHLDFTEGVKELFSNPVLLQKYIDEDTAFKFELQERGHSVYNSIHFPKIKDAQHKGSISQHEARNTETFHYSVYKEEKRGYEKTAREKKQDARLQSMLTSSYVGKLHKSGLYDKVMKALKEPHQVQEALTDLEMGSGEVEKFSIIGQDVLEVLQDPVMMQILLSQDPEALDTFMRSYPELTMKLLARNKTSYGLGGMGSRRGYRDIDMLHSRYYRDRFDRDRFGRDPFDSDSDDEMSDLLMRAGYGRRALRGMAAEGDMDQRLLDMIFKEERRKRRDEDYHRRQTAVRKEKKQEPTIKVEPKPEEKPANKIEPKPSEEKPANKIEPKPSEEKPTIKVEPKPSEEKPANKIEPKPSEEKPANKIEPKTLEVGGKDKGSLGPDVIIKVSASAKLDQKPASIPKTAENDKDCPDPGPVSKDSVLSEEKNHPVTMNSGIKDSKPDGVEKPKKPVPFPLSGEASMDEMSIEDTADGVILYSEADRTTVDDKMGVTEAITVLKTETQTRVPNLQLRLLDELPIGGKTEFNYIEYILSHFNYIFIYLTPNFTPDTLKRFQSQMCLMDTIQNKSWRVIPIVREKDIANMPLEMQVLRPLQLWNLKNPDKRVQNMAVESFAKTILAGRENGYATKYPSLGASRNIVQQPDAAAKVPLNKQVPAKPPNISSEAPSDRQQGNAGSQVPNPSENNTTEEDAELGSDEESLTGEEKPGLKKATPGLHTLLHKHSGGGVTKISFISGGKIPNLQVGNKNVMIIGASGDAEKKKSKSKKSKENVKLTDSEEPLSKDNIDAVCSEIGQEWRRLCRKMGFSDGECDQFRQDFYVSGTYEIMYQAFRKWIQKSPGEAIQKNLAEMLHELDRDDLATKL